MPLYLHHKSSKDNKFESSYESGHLRSLKVSKRLQTEFKQKSKTELLKINSAVIIERHVHAPDSQDEGNPSESEALRCFSASGSDSNESHLSHITIPTIDVPSMSTYIDTSSSYMYTMACYTFGEVSQSNCSSDAFQVWVDEKNNQQRIKKQKEKAKKLKLERIEAEKKIIREQKLKEWSERKKQERRDKLKQSLSKPVSAKKTVKRAESHEEWCRRKNEEERKAMELKQQEKEKARRIAEQRGIANKHVYQQWVIETAKKPKPKHPVKGWFGLFRNNAPTWVNPISWVGLELDVPDDE